MTDGQTLLDEAMVSDKAVHIHQQQCFVSVRHSVHIIYIGEYAGVVYFYRCLGVD